MVSLSVQLQFSTDDDRVKAVENKYAGHYSWKHSKQLTICEVVPEVTNTTKFAVPLELRELEPRVVFHFEEELEYNKVEVCGGLSGKALRPYFLGSGLFDDGAMFSVRDAIAVVTCTRRENQPHITIRQFKLVKIRGWGLKVNESCLLEDKTSLPPELERFALPVELANDYNVGRINYSPLYWDETDEQIKASYCYRYGTAWVKCLKCNKEHEVPLEVLLRDPRMRLKLLREYGSPAQTLIGEMPARLCQFNQVSGKE